MKLFSGIVAIPAVPKATIVRKGPLFKDKTAIEPTSVSSPNSPDNALKRPPLLLVIAAITASEERPNNPLSPKSFAISSPIITPIKNFVKVITAPFLRASGAALKFIPAPIQTRKAPIKAEEPWAIAVVNPPIFKACGHNVLIRAPIINGTTIIPPGILSIFFLMFIC